MTAKLYTQADAIRLVDKYQPALYRYVYACVHNHTDAEDIFQDVVVQVFESIGRLHHENAFYAWSREIAFKKILEFLRLQKRESSINPHVVSALAEAFGRSEVVPSPSPKREALFECLKKLPLQSREMIELRYGDSADGIAEVASRYHLSTNAVYLRLSRIRRVLRDCVTRRLAKGESK